MDNRGILDWPPKDRDGKARVVRISRILGRFDLEQEQLASFSTTEIVIENVQEVN